MNKDRQNEGQMRNIAKFTIGALGGLAAAAYMKSKSLSMASLKSLWHESKPMAIGAPAATGAGLAYLLRDDKTEQNRKL